MKKLLLISAAFLGSLSFVEAQTPAHPQYVKNWGEGEAFSNLYGSWQPGQALSTERADDEEFFISRVKPLRRFTESETQVNNTLTQDRKLLWWVPIGMPGWNALPSYFFNSEVFSMWSYLDHWGNWTATYLRMPGAFSDVAHKNGVSVSCTATPGFGRPIDPSDNSWGQAFYSVSSGGADKYITYLRYYGMDGAGYNSEQGWSSELVNSYKPFLKEASQKASEVGLFNYSNVWYGITDSRGGTSQSWDSLDAAHRDWFNYNGGTTSTHYFLNYNWSNSHLTVSEKTANGFDRSTYDVYAGINMQRGILSNWATLFNSHTSIGIWGAHRSNMIFENRGSAGASAMAQQNEYQKASECIFTGGYRNPIKHYPITDNKLPSGSGSASQFFGMSKVMPARSTLSWDLSESPFVTYFNLGNGTFFNIEGEKKFSGEWYNIGMQDFMPSWRWWFSKSFMGKDEDQYLSNPLDAKFIWDDAWFGGSCLQINGTTTDTQYLQLFKTKYEVQNGDKIRVRYKVVNGTGEIKLTAYMIGDNTEYNSDILTTDSEFAYGEWQEVVIPIENSGRKALTIGGKTLGVIGLKFANTSSLSVRIGEISLYRGEYTTPDAPIVKKAISLENNYKGADFKIIYSMDKMPRKDNLVTYNDDVKTWFYKIYCQQEGGDIEFCTATTSWAAYVVGAKFDVSGTHRMRYGVSAVSLDGTKESDISWSEYMDMTTANVVEGIKADKPILNIGQSATISFSDPTHAEATHWELKRGDDVISSQDGGKSFTVSPDQIGTYTVFCTVTPGNVITKTGMVTVVPTSAGCMPEIKTLTANNKTDGINLIPDEQATMAYTSKNSNGAVSRALRLANASFKISNLFSALGVRLGNSSESGEGGLTVSFWFRPDNTVYAEGEDGMRMFDISKASERWPMSEWGYFWINYGQGHAPNGRDRSSYQGFTWTNVSSRYDANNAREKIVDTDPYVLEPGVWYHMTVKLTYGLDAYLYINGKRIAYLRSNGIRRRLFNDSYELNISKYVKFASTFDGYIDEVRVYNKELADDQIPSLMSHIEDLSAEEAKGLKAYFDFENENNGSNLPSRVGGVNATLSRLTWGGEGQQSWTPIQKVDFGASTALVVGSSYPIITTPQWNSSKAQFSELQNTETEGSAKVKWQKKGAYPVTLTLENAWGTDSKTYNVVTVAPKATAIEDIQPVDLSVYPNPFVDNIRLHFAKSGNYRLYLYDLNGTLVTEKTVGAVAGTLYSMNVNAQSGVYLLKIVLEDKVVSCIKLQKK